MANKVAWEAWKVRRELWVAWEAKKMDMAARKQVWEVRVVTAARKADMASNKVDTVVSLRLMSTFLLVVVSTSSNKSGV